MPFDVLLALTVFACVMAFTPGPNNILLTASGVNFGFARTIPHLIGVDIGFVVLLAAFAAGLGVVFAAVPALPSSRSRLPARSICSIWRGRSAPQSRKKRPRKRPAVR